MANEAVWLEKPLGGTNPYQFTVASGTAISKGTLMVLSSDPRTAIASSGFNQVFVGIANADKSASDGATRIGVDTEGIYDLTIVSAGNGSTIALGDLVELSGANLIRGIQFGGISGAMYVSGAKLAFGRALEIGSASEVIAVKIPA